MTEIAIVSSRKPRLEKLAANGNSGAKVALELANEPTILLSTVQIGISLIGVVTGAYGGITIAQALVVYLKPLPIIGPYAVTFSMTLVVTSITYTSLIIGELVPKRLALNNPEPIAILIARPMKFLSKLFLPIVKLLGASTEFVLKLLGVQKPLNDGVTEDEIKIMLAEGTLTGMFEETEKDIVDRVFRLGDMRVAALMTPRTQIDWLDLDRDDDYLWSVIKKSPHTKLPVARDSLDEILGIVYVKDLLANRDNGNLPIEANIEQPLFVPRSLRAFKLLKQFQQSGTHVAFVMDEFGGTMGLVTLHDILENLVGELPEEDDDEKSIVERDNCSWLIDGLLPIEEFKDFFALDEMPGEDKDHYQTIGGFITSYLGYMPKTGETFIWSHLQFEVVDMDRMRIDKLLVTKLICDLQKEE
ncbi:MAG TPA: HlyC/CorC family transporter [Candidatus Avacidaminococcus intestinavium]|uniref:HlyC/CorC family transporter n=1 Tax=Candidatus Avacidaminococcus intestinavium TaxID=2840684 RepID=A0A9D1MRI9_9FIRM|nr:HlyC/CorC family transporter [Candidatus Avacidaminococcus intestinavium]